MPSSSNALWRRVIGLSTLNTFFTSTGDDLTVVAVINKPDQILDNIDHIVQQGHIQNFIVFFTVGLVSRQKN